MHQNVATALGEGQRALSEFWKGGGAQSASAGLNPLVQANHTAAQNMQQARQSMFEQNQVFHERRGSLSAISSERPDDSGLDDMISIGASDDEVAAAQWDTDNRNNMAQYEAYFNATEANRPKLAPDYGPVAATPTAAPPDAHGPGSKVDGGRLDGFDAPSGRGGNDDTHAAGFTDPGGGRPQTPPPAAPPPPQAPPPPVAGPPQGPLPGTGPSNAQPKPGPRPQTPRPGPMPPGGGLAQGPRPGGFGPRPGGTAGFGPGGSRGPGFGPGGGAPRGPGGFGPTGSVPSQPGAGRLTGGGLPGEAVRGGPAAAQAGGRGTPGMSGMAPGAAGAGRGQGAEDEEHQRKTVFVPDDPEGLFGGLPDGERPTPPTIGA
ncbi:hypothetical protein [Amycolatopsis suaedae]|uniref:PPE domain-containing protein n=1 Tax=Amycolatopsis suaedae TaxID=2510978 RepID=A0A4Q7JDW1_9PSEU|nr:hypothetical protein [Amycolatopsis suaedae]RZQ65398.1 hypothetical protein EWH70_05880 [Amycolatopsis suaedae]